MSRRLVIFGAGGHAKVVVDAIVQQGDSVAGVFDGDAGRYGQEWFGYTVLGGLDAMIDFAASEGVDAVVVAIGDNRIRSMMGARIAERGLRFDSVVHPRAVVSPSARIGAGCVVMAGAVINADAVIGEHAIINTCASVDHDCWVAEGAHIGPGARLCGGVKVGRRVLFGAGAVAIPGFSVGDDAIVPAGGVVRGDVPARTRHPDKIRSSQSNEGE